MATSKEHDRFDQTPSELRWSELGPSLLSLLTTSTGLAVLILAVIWFAFFRV